jgi:hypothetical protein
VDLLLKRHQVLLKAIYSRYRLKPSGGGLRSKMLRLEGWLQLLSDAHLVDGQFTLQVCRGGALDRFGGDGLGCKCTEEALENRWLHAFVLA